jgi:hypothetical protein
MAAVVKLPGFRTPCLAPTRRVEHFTAKLGDRAILGFSFCKCLAVAEARPNLNAKEQTATKEMKEYHGKEAEAI